MTTSNRSTTRTVGQGSAGEARPVKTHPVKPVAGLASRLFVAGCSLFVIFFVVVIALVILRIALAGKR